MHNLTKIRVYRALLYISYLPSLLLMWPPARLKKKNPGHLFFFFDRTAMGGAQRVHLDLLKSVENEYKQIYFTRFSPNHILHDAFYNQPNADVKDIHKWCDNLFFRLFTVHYMAFYLNRHREGHIFSSNSTFFYDLLPFLKKRLVKTELLHMFTFGNNGMEFFGLANYNYLDYRVLVDFLTRQSVEAQYAANNIPPTYAEKLLVIEPGVAVPQTFPPKTRTEKLKVLYAGRGGPQKRVWILNKIAERCLDAGLPVEFHFAGTMMEELSDKVKKASVLHGEISNPEEMAALNRLADVLLMTSAYEGFPMAIKEAMAQGCIPVVTALEGNKTHLTDGGNSILLQNITDEALLEEEGFEQIKRLASDRELLVQLSLTAYTYAQKHFDRAGFYEAYAKLLTRKANT